MRAARLSPLAGHLGRPLPLAERAVPGTQFSRAGGSSWAAPARRAGCVAPVPSGDAGPVSGEAAEPPKEAERTNKQKPAAIGSSAGSAAQGMATSRLRSPVAPVGTGIMPPAGDGGEAVAPEERTAGRQRRTGSAAPGAAAAPGRGV